MAVNSVIINGVFYHKAILLYKRLYNKDFCQSIILISEAKVLHLQPFLDYHAGIDFFSIRAVDYLVGELPKLIDSHGDDVSSLGMDNIDSLNIRVGGFFGDEGTIIEVAEIIISATDGLCVSIFPDPERDVSDQMLLTSVL